MTEKRPTRSRLQVQFDLENSKTSMGTENDLGAQICNVHRLSTFAAKSELYGIADSDPLSANAHIAWNFKYKSGKWLSERQTQTQMFCDENGYFITAKVSVFKGRYLIFKKSFNRETLPTFYFLWATYLSGSLDCIKRL